MAGNSNTLNPVRKETAMKTLKRILVVMATLLLGLLLVLPSPLITSARPPPVVNLEVTIFGLTLDGLWSSSDNTYATAHTASTGTIEDDSSLRIGQGRDGATYYVQRAGLFFDTIVLPDDPILSARLSLFYAGLVPWEDFDVTLVDGAALDDPLAPEDYGDLFDSVESGGSVKTQIALQITSRKGLKSRSMERDWVGSIPMV
jgi:hypothetical protein